MAKEEYFVDNDRIHSFVETVKATANNHEQVEPLLTDLEESFKELLTNDDHYHPNDGHAELEKVRTEQMKRGDFYKLVPPNNDIHSVTTTSAEPSVSVHLLGADVGCIERHTFNPEEKEIERFQSGYSNIECDVTLDSPAGD